ncbi:MAG: hypothetical protein WCF94_00960 [bacterium]
METKVLFKSRFAGQIYCVAGLLRLPEISGLLREILLDETVPYRFTIEDPAKGKPSDDHGVQVVQTQDKSFVSVRVFCRGRRCVCHIICDGTASADALRARLIERWGIERVFVLGINGYSPEYMSEQEAKNFPPIPPELHEKVVKSADEDDDSGDGDEEEDEMAEVQTAMVNGQEFCFRHAVSNSFGAYSQIFGKDKDKDKLLAQVLREFVWYRARFSQVKRQVKEEIDYIVFPKTKVRNPMPSVDSFRHLLHCLENEDYVKINDIGICLLGAEGEKLVSRYPDERRKERYSRAGENYQKPRTRRLPKVII